MSRWKDNDLDDFALHVEYEVEMLVGQVELLVDFYGPGGPAGSFTSPQDEAILDAALVHLRLLDEFLGSKGRATDVKAKYWVPGWPARNWLDRSVRDRINWQLVHLSTLREVGHGWDLCEYARACCEELVRFFDEVKKQCPPERLEAFGSAPEIASDGKTKFGAHLA